MESRATKLALLGAAVAVAVTLFVVLSDGDDEPAAPERAVTEGGKVEPAGGDQGAPKPKPRPPEATTIEVEGGQPVGGVQKLSFVAGEEIRFEVVSDVAEEVHVHGYDVIQDVTPGKPVTFEFAADIEGVFEVELEESHVQIAELEVTPG